jgi:hypothetical protein
MWVYEFREGVGCENFVFSGLAFPASALLAYPYFYFTAQRESIFFYSGNRIAHVSFLGSKPSKQSPAASGTSSIARSSQAFYATLRM